MKNLNNKINILEKAGFIPSGLNLPIEMSIQDVRATRYDYYGNKYAESNEFYENVAVSIKIQHSKVELPFWITIFEGATYREETTNCIIATSDALIDENYNMQTENNTIYKTDCITEDEETEGLDSIKEVLFAFKCRLIDGDESGLYTNGENPTFHNGGILMETADELISLIFIEIKERLSKENPNPTNIKEIQSHLLEAASGNLYCVTVVFDSCIKAHDQFLLKEEAEELFVKYCHKYYSDHGTEKYCDSKDYESYDELTVEDWESYFHSDAWYDENDLANVEIKLM